MITIYILYHVPDALKPFHTHSLQPINISMPWICPSVYFILQIKYEVTVSCPRLELPSYYWSQNWSTSSQSPTLLTSLGSRTHSSQQNSAFLNRAVFIIHCSLLLFPPSLSLYMHISTCNRVSSRHTFPWKWTPIPKKDRQKVAFI